MMFNINQAVVAAIMMLAAAASVDKVAAVSAVTATVHRRVKSGKNGPTPPKGQYYTKKNPKSSKKNSPTPNPLTAPIPAPALPPLSYRPTDVPTMTAPEPEPTDGPTEEPTPDPFASPTAAAPEPTDGPTEETKPLLDIPNTVPEDYSEEGYTILMSALWHTPDYLMETLFTTGPFTLFAPTNAAFRLLDEDLYTCLAEPRYWDVLQDVLMYHVADGEYSTEQLVNDQVINMWDGQELLINIDDGTVVINDNDNDNDNAKVVLPNVLASNGILHGIDRVLMPPGT